MAADAEKSPERWLYQLTTTEIEAVDRALKTTLAKGHKDCSTMTKEDFPLGLSDNAINTVLDRVENDMGIFVLRGLPAEKYTKPELRMIYWGIGLNIGVAVSQSGKGDFLGDVRNYGDSITPMSKGGRGYMSRVHLSFHTDSSDIVALMVLTTAKSGGRSMICSSIAVRNEIARRRPDLLKVLYEDFYWSWKGTERPGTKPYYVQPIFSEEGGRFAARFIYPHIFTAQEYPEVPRLTEAQKEAIKLVDSVANEQAYHLGMMFEPGDIQFLNNHITMHARTEFEDGETEDTKRHLIRMWLSPSNSRRLNPKLEFFENKDPGVVRGGFPCHTGQHLYETVATDL